MWNSKRCIHIHTGDKRSVYIKRGIRTRPRCAVILSDIHGYRTAMREFCKTATVSAFKATMRRSRCFEYAYFFWDAAKKKGRRRSKRKEKIQQYFFLAPKPRTHAPIHVALWQGQGNMWLKKTQTSRWTLEGKPIGENLDSTLRHRFKTNYSSVYTKASRVNTRRSKRLESKKISCSRLFAPDDIPRAKVPQTTSLSRDNR